MSHARGYRISMRNLIKQSSDGRDATYAALREAKRLGYVDVRRVRDHEGRYTGAVWTVRWKPVEFDSPARRPSSSKAHHSPSTPREEEHGSHVLNSRSEVVPERIQQVVEVKDVLQEQQPLEWDGIIPAPARAELGPLLEQLPNSAAQQVADELAGRLHSGSVRGPVTRYARSIVQRALEGHFVPSAGVGIAELRARRAQDAAATLERQQSAREHRKRVAKQRSDPEMQRRLSEMFKSLKADS